MKILYVIGNGFDLWHKLPTSYGHFYDHASDLLEELSEYFYSEPDASPLWSNFEEDLGRFDWQSLYDAHNEIDVSDDNFKPSMVYGLEDALTEEADHITDAIHDTFVEWIESIDIEGSEGDFLFERNCRVLSFNYTSTLQELYQLQAEHVFHIHGRVGDHRLIIGHGDALLTEPELDENGDSNRHMFSDAQGAAKAPLYKFKKPVLEIIAQNTDYFKSLSEIQIVAVLGHSLNDIDVPYFEAINNMTVNAQWFVSYYTEADRENHISTLLKIGIDSTKIRTLLMEEIPIEIKKLI